MHAHKLQINILNVITIAGRKCCAALRVRIARLLRPPPHPVRRTRQKRLILSGSVALLLFFVLSASTYNNVNSTNYNNIRTQSQTNATLSDRIQTQNRHKLNENPEWQQQRRKQQSSDSSNLEELCCSNNSSKFNSSCCNIADNRKRSESSGALLIAAVNSNSASDFSTLKNLKLLKTKRMKRFLTFSGSGIVKFVFGVSFPVMLADKKRSLAHFYNFQMQYIPPPTPLYWWSIYNTSTFPARQQRRQNRQAVMQDWSRTYIYAAIEQVYERHSLPGEACLLQAICEVSQRPFYESTLPFNSFAQLLHKILNAIFIPTAPNIAEKYTNAREAAKYGVNCQETFNACPATGNNWLTRLSHLQA